MLSLPHLILAIATLTSPDESLPASTAVVFAAKGGTIRQSTGVLLDREKRWLLASWHAVEGSKEMSVLFPLVEHGRLKTAPLPYQEQRRQGKASAARLVLADPRSDLALLELDFIPEGANAAVLVKPPRVREQVILIGNPPARNVLWQRCTAVILSAGPRKWNYDDGQVVETTALEVSVTSALENGYSGGPVFTRRHELAAVIAAEKERGSTTIYCVDAAAIRLFVLEAQLRDAWRGLPGPCWAR